MLRAAFDRCAEELGLHLSSGVVVGVSGGSDSMALWALAEERLGCPVHGLHVDHGLREGSAAEANWMVEQGNARGWSCAATRLGGVGADEASLRAARYAALEAARLARGADWVLLAHHREDQAETVLMRLITRGGPRGMPKTRGRIARPLLDVPRAHLRAFVEQSGIPFIEDPSNRDVGYLRNRLRRELLPLLERAYRPGIHRRLAALGARAPGITARRALWPSLLGPGEEAFDVDAVGSPSFRPLAELEGLVAEHLDGVRALYGAQSPWVLEDHEGLLWIPGVVRFPRGLPNRTTARVWIFGMK